MQHAIYWMMNKMPRYMKKWWNEEQIFLSLCKVDYEIRQVQTTMCIINISQALLATSVATPMEAGESTVLSWTRQN